jgi:hypothetical protein
MSLSTTSVELQSKVIPAYGLDHMFGEKRLDGAAVAANNGFLPTVLDPMVSPIISSFLLRSTPAESVKRRRHFSATGQFFSDLYRNSSGNVGREPLRFATVELTALTS